MITLISIAICYTIIGVLIYDTAKETPMAKRDQLLYSILWPWLFIASAACLLWDILFPSD